MQYKIKLVVFALSFTSSVFNANATELTYTPVNPSFGGNPLNSSHLFNVANGINDYSSPNSGFDFGEESSALDSLAASLESRLISQLLGDVGNGNSGQVETDDFILNIVDSDNGLAVQIVDKSTGDSSEIFVNGLNPDL